MNVQEAVFACVTAVCVTVVIVVFLWALTKL
jgi:hypothetical protein